MKRKLIRNSRNILLCFIVIVGVSAPLFVSADDIFTESRREVLTDLDKWNDADPNDWIPDNAHGAYATMHSFSVEEILYLYENGKYNVHHLAMLYVEDPEKYVLLEPYAKQSEHLDEYASLYHSKDQVDTKASSGAKEEENGDVVSGQQEVMAETEDGVPQDESEAVETWEIIDTVEPTCEEKGYIKYLNSVTGETKTEETDALGHDEGEWVTVSEATLLSSGTKELRCTRDDTVLDIKKIPSKFVGFFKKLFRAY